MPHARQRPHGTKPSIGPSLNPGSEASDLQLWQQACLPRMKRRPCATFVCIYLYLQPPHHETRVDLKNNSLINLYPVHWEMQ